MAAEADAPAAMPLQDFKLMSIESLRDFLSLRSKSPEGDFDTLVAR